MAQVALEFSKKKKELGAKTAAQALDVCIASFYKYAAGTDLPRMEVLRDAQVKWGIKWELIDPSELLAVKTVQSAKQLVFSFLEHLREKDVEITKIRPLNQSVLQVTLNIRFPA